MFKCKLFYQIPNFRYSRDSIEYYYSDPMLDQRFFEFRAGVNELLREDGWIIFGGIFED